MSLRRVAAALARRLPGVRRVVEERDALRKVAAALYVEPGHYYSPIPSLEEARAHGSRALAHPDALPAIRLNEAEQVRLAGRLAEFYGEMPFPETATAGRRYYFLNPNFSYGDAILLYAMLRYLEPRRVIEVGSGFSSCVTLDTNELFFGGSIQCTFIDPFPDLLLALTSEEDRARSELVRARLQDVDVDRFAVLGENDVLFIDSTHVSKVGSDVNVLFFDVLPRLRRGVYIHVHDVFYPFEYPARWVVENRAWNENYILRAFLQYNEAFEIVLFNHFLGERHAEFMTAKMPLFMKNTGGSLWLRKVA